VRRVTLALLALCLLHAVHADELEPFEARYAWVWHGMTVAVSTLTLAHRDGDWVYRSKSEPRGMGRMFSERPTQESIIRVTDSGAEPLSYKADDGTPSTAHDADVRFDWARGRVTGVYEDVPIDLPTRAGLQDDLSVQIALMLQLLRGRTPDNFLLLDKDAMREYSYSREGEETLSTSIGKLQTIIFQSHKQGSPRVNLFWCAPARNYIPLRVEQRRKGEVQWTMQIESLTLGPG